MGRVSISLILTIFILLSGCIDPLDPLDRNSSDEVEDSNPDSDQDSDQD